MNTRSYPVSHNRHESRFEATIDGKLCVADYRRQGDTLHMTHTLVPPALEGRGIAAAIVRAAIAHARAEGLKIAPHCSYVRAFMQRHSDTLDLMAAA